MSVDTALKCPPRVLLAKIGLDGHDRGVKVLARSFRDAGIEVIYTGLWQTCEATMCAALQEDVDVVGVSLLSAAHMTVMPEILRIRKELDIDHIPVVLGGIVPEADKPALLEMGIAAVFNPGSAIDDIVETLRGLAAKHERVDFNEVRAGYKKRDVRALAKLVTTLLRGVPVFARDILKVGVTGQGLLLTGMGLGALCSAVLIATVGDRLPRGMIMLVGVMLYGLTIVAFALSPWFELTMGLMVFTGLFHVTSHALVQTVIQGYSPSEFRGRTIAVFQQNHVMLTVGSMLLGFMATLWGARWALALMGIAGMLSMIMIHLTLPSARHIR